MKDKVQTHDFEVGDLIVSRTAHVLFSSDIDVLYYGLFFVDIKEDEVMVVIEIAPLHVTVRTEDGRKGWQSAHHFELLQKASKS
jgi:hypothetical protein|tara:strand:+ start:1055 stop:1306 length:252 start_codon:yes stop_codon:yes gene_type:complete